MWRRVEIVCGLVGLAIALILAIGHKSDSKEVARSRLRVRASYGNLPIAFEHNQGQTDPRVSYLARGHGYVLFLTPTSAVFTLNQPKRKRDGVFPIDRSGSLGAEKQTRQAVIRVELMGANAHSRVEAIQPLPGKVNYFRGHDSNRWRTQVQTYARVKFADAYPGIDLIYHGSREQQLEYDFVVNPKADPSLIHLSFPDADGLRLARNGDLIVNIAGAEFVERAPEVYQESDHGKRKLAGSYMLSARNMASFLVKSWDRTKPLVIDPVLVYSTFLGGSSDIQNNVAIAADFFSNTYLTGSTPSTDFPTTPGAFNTVNAGGQDVYVTKLNPTGKSVLYSTYLGGSSNDFGSSIAVDSGGNAYLTGFTQSSDFPTTVGAFQSVLAGSGNAFVTKLNVTGSALVYSTYLGGNGSDSCGSVAVDSSGSAYVACGVSSTNFPTTAGALQSSYGGSGDAAVAKLNAGGTALVYSTFLGGSANDSAASVAVDSYGSAYVAGYSVSSDFPVTPGAFQATPGGDIDAFVSKLSPSGTAFIYSTFLGGSGADGPGTNSIAVDSSGNAYVTGSTRSTDFPTTSGAFQTAFGGNSCGGCPGDAFITKLNASGTALIYSTYLGGSGYDAGGEVAVDSAGDAYLVGFTNSPNFPITTNAIQPTSGGSQDAFVSKLNAAGSALIYSSYLGGSANEWGYGVALDPSGNAFVAGQTQSADFPTTAGAYQTSLNASFNAFVTDVNLSIWPMFHHDVRHTGLSVFDTSANTGGLKWQFTAGALVGSSPAIAPDGTIYFGSDDHNFYALNPDGSQKWVFATGGTVDPSPAIAPDGTIYFSASDDGLYALNPDGSQKWKFIPICSTATPTIGIDGTIYVPSTADCGHAAGPGLLIALNPEGTQKWTFSTNGVAGPVPTIGADGTIYVGSFGGTFYAINPDGSQKWQFATGSNEASSGSSVGADGSIYFGSDAGIVFALNPDGSQKWQFSTGASVVASPAIGSDGVVYIGSFDGNLYALNPDGSQHWALNLNSPVLSSAALGADGTILVGTSTSDSSLYAINPNGTQRWKFTTGSAVNTSPAIGTDGTVYVGSNDSKLYAIGAVTSTPTSSATSTPTSTATGTATATATATPTPAVTSLGPVDVWVGLKNSDDQGTQFDLRAEVRQNSTLIATGEILCISGITRNPGAAKQVSIPVDSVTPSGYSSGDTLSVRILTRIGTNPNGSKCAGHSNAVGLRLYYDSSTQSSQITDSITAVPAELFFHSNGNLCTNAPSTGVTNRFLDGNAPTATGAKCQDSGSVNFAGGNSWSTINDWNLALP